MVDWQVNGAVHPDWGVRPHAAGEAVHWPATQTSPFEQSASVAHAELDGVQVPATQWSPPEQSASVVQAGAAVHTPASHVSPAGQRLPHAPQLLASLRRSTQAAEQ